LHVRSTVDAFCSGNILPLWRTGNAKVYFFTIQTSGTRTADTGGTLEKP
jgi:hypothetical protein